MRMKASIELDAGTKTFASGLLPELIAALRRSRSGDLVAVISGETSVGADLEAWCRFTRNTLVDVTAEAGRMRWVVRYGEAPANSDADRPVGSRLWLYTNFDCNLRCDYCCVRSSPKAPRRALGLERVKRIAIEAGELGVNEIFVTGGEPFLLADIGEIWLRAPPPRRRRYSPTACCSRGGGSKRSAHCQAIAWHCRSALTAQRPSDTTAIAERAHGRVHGRA
jgi:TusA-related sulfurtransferase